MMYDAELMVYESLRAWNAIVLGQIKGGRHIKYCCKMRI